MSYKITWNFSSKSGYEATTRQNVDRKKLKKMSSIKQNERRDKIKCLFKHKPTN